MASKVNKDGLQLVLDSGDEKECVNFFRGMPEEDRRQYFAVVRPFWNLIRKSRFIEDPPGTFRWNSRAEIADAAFLATASGAEIRKARLAGQLKDEVVFEIIADRRPDWVDDWVRSMLEESWYWNHWRLIRRLIIAGLAKKPDSSRYFLGMISALNGRRNEGSLALSLQQAPDLLEEDIWKLFEFDGEGENSLANTERFEGSWTDAFLALMNEGRLPRARLLQATIEALERDFNHYRAKWFYEFFDRLEPAEEELRYYGERLLGLLGVSAPNVASWALRRVEPLAKSGAFRTATFCHAIEPILRARAKGTVLTAIKMLERQAVSAPHEASIVSMTVATALAHESPEVQKATFRLLESISSPNDEKVYALVQKFQPVLAASVRGTAAKWLERSGSTLVNAGTLRSPMGTSSDESDSGFAPGVRQVISVATSAPVPEISGELELLYSIDVLRRNQNEGVFEIPAAIFDGTELPRLSLVRQVIPVTTIEDLIDVCAQVIEDGTLVDDAERCIDGLARLCGSRPADIDLLTAPLLKRVRSRIQKRCSPFCGVDPAYDVMGLFYTFCTGQLIVPVLKSGTLQFEFEGTGSKEYSINTKKPIGFLSAHCLSVARRIAAGEALQLLSTPTHAGGWIDAIELAKRVSAWSVSVPDLPDVILAMLRLAPQNREAALKLLADRPEEWCRAIRHALGAPNIPVGDTAALWAAAARARAPWHNDPHVSSRHPGLGPDAAEAADISIQIKTRKSGPYTFYSAGFAVQPRVPDNVDPMLVTVLMFASQSIGKEYSFEMGGFAGRTDGAVRWSATIWPLARESWFAACAGECLSNIDWSEAQWQNRTMLEPLLDSGTPLRKAGVLLLAGMLGAKEPGESGLATDIAIRAIDDGRLGSDNLGEALSLLLTSGLIKPGRWKKTLTEVAAASPVHSAIIQIALQQCFSDPAKELPKDSAKLLELLYELSVDAGIPLTSESCRTFLASGTASGKSAKMAKSLLDLNGHPEGHDRLRSIREKAVERRLVAASRMRLTNFSGSRHE